MVDPGKKKKKIRLKTRDSLFNRPLWTSVPQRGRRDLQRERSGAVLCTIQHAGYTSQGCSSPYLLCWLVHCLGLWRYQVKGDLGCGQRLQRHQATSFRDAGAWFNIYEALVRPLPFLYRNLVIITGAHLLFISFQLLISRKGQLCVETQAWAVSPVFPRVGGPECTK